MIKTCSLFSLFAFLCIFKFCLGDVNRFDKVEVDADSWQVLQVRKNVLSHVYCSIQCLSSNVFSAFIYNKNDKSCQMGIYGNTRPPNGGPTVAIFAKQGTYRILVGGGSSAANTYETRFEIVDMDSPLTRCQNPPSVTIGFRVAVGNLNYQNQPFYCGGEIGSSDYTSQCYYLADNIWHTGNPMLRARAYFGLARNPFNDSPMFSFIGSVYSNNNNIELLYPSGPSLVTSSSSPNMVLACPMFVNESTIMIIAIKEYNILSKNTYYFNLNTKVYSAGPPLINSRTFCSCGRIKKDRRSKEKTFIVAGGKMANPNPLNSVEAFDNDLNQWVQRNPLPFSYILFGPAMVEDPNGAVVVLGGNNEATIYRLLNAGIGTEWEVMATTLKVPTQYHIAMILPNFTSNCTWP